jgi:hypothetical protein
MSVFRARPGTGASMLLRTLDARGLRDWHLQGLSLASIGLCIALWIRAKTVDQEERGNAERRALFVGLWPPMFWLMGDSLQRVGSTRALRAAWSSIRPKA